MWYYISHLHFTAHHLAAADEREKLILRIAPYILIKNSPAWPKTTAFWELHLTSCTDILCYIECVHFVLHIAYTHVTQYMYISYILCTFPITTFTFHIWILHQKKSFFWCCYACPAGNVFFEDFIFEYFILKIHVLLRVPLNGVRGIQKTKCTYFSNKNKNAPAVAGALWWRAREILGRFD